MTEAEPSRTPPNEERKKTPDSSLSGLESLLVNWFALNLVLGVSWWILWMTGGASTKAWPNKPVETSILYVAASIFASVFLGFSERSSARRGQGHRTTLDLIMNDPLLTGSAEINALTAKYTLWNWTWFGLFSASSFLAGLFFLRGIYAQNVIFYLCGLAPFSFVMLFDNRYRYESRAGYMRYLQSSTDYYVMMRDRMKDIE